LITVDPSKRATLAEVMSHPWVNDGYDCIPDSYVPDRPELATEELLPDLVRRLEIFGYSKAEIHEAFSRSMDQSKPHPIRATYHLLDEMVKRELKLRASKDSIAKQNSSLATSSQTLTNSNPDLTLASSQSSIHNEAELSRPRLSTGIYRAKRTPNKRSASALQSPSYENTETVIKPFRNVTLQEIPNHGNSTGTTPRNYSTPAIVHTPAKTPSTADKIKEEIRAVSGWFLNYSTTTSKKLDMVVDDISEIIPQTRVLEATSSHCLLECDVDLGTPNWANNFTFGTPKKGIKMQVTLRTVPMTKLTAVHFKRITGGSWSYKKVCSKLLQELRL
jgi:MAP/microtubule affinity-regulating kinase